MPTYTLYYFNGRGRAEICRILFAAADVKYLDKRFEFSEWESYRNDMPGMCLPVLEMDGGNRMPETMAIARYLAREFGFYGRNSFDMFRCDYLCDCFYEIMHDYMKYFHWKNGRFRQNPVCADAMRNLGAKSKEAKSTNFTKYLQWRYMNTCDRVLPFLENNLSSRHSGNQFFLGDQMMLCDMMCYSCLENPFMENKAMFIKYPKLVALRDRVAAHPKVCAYIKSRCNSMW